MKLIVITDWSRPDCLERATAAARVSPEVAIQHRQHGAPREVFVENARRLRDACPTLFINSDAELALALGAGLHLPAHLELAFEGPVTKAVHAENPSPVGRGPREAGGEGRTFLLSPVFNPLSKPHERPELGVVEFHRIAATLPGPVFALGGLTPERIAALQPLAGAAVIGAVMHAPDAARATEALLEALSRAEPVRPRSA